MRRAYVNNWIVLNTAGWAAREQPLESNEGGFNEDTGEVRIGPGLWADLEPSSAPGGAPRYVARLAQAGAFAPTATIKSNTLRLGVPTFGYIGDGIYQVSLVGLSLATHSAQVILNKDVPCTVITLFNAPDFFFIQAWDNTGSNADGIVNEALLVIEEL